MVCALCLFCWCYWLCNGYLTLCIVTLMCLCTMKMVCVLLELVLISDLRMWLMLYFFIHTFAKLWQKIGVMNIATTLHDLWYVCYCSCLYVLLWCVIWMRIVFYLLLHIFSQNLIKGVIVFPFDWLHLVKQHAQHNM